MRGPFQAIFESVHGTIHALFCIGSDGWNRTADHGVMKDEVQRFVITVTYDPDLRRRLFNFLFRGHSCGRL